MRIFCFFVYCTVCLLPFAVAAQESTGAQSESQDQESIEPSAGMLRYPDVSSEKIVFSYAGDLWTVDREGGLATPLASPAGNELFPRFSPDGQSIAFVGNYEGDEDLYTIPTSGGIATRVTYHPANEILCDWHPVTEKLIYSTNGFAGLGRQQQLFSISVEEPLAEPLPVPYGTNASVSEDGEWLAYTPHSRDTRTWKRYRGGMASDIWLFNLETHEAKQITDWEGTDSLPMFFGNRVYYLSDAGPEHRLNIWVYDIESEERHQVTEFADYGCKWPAIGPGPDGQGEIVVQNGASLYLVDLGTEEATSIRVRIPGDRPKLRPNKVDASEFITDGDISPSAKRVTVAARGDIWTLPAESGPPRNLTHTDGVAERSPSWSPDGQWIAYFSDATGEYELYVTQSDGRGETKQLTTDGSAFRYDPVWSPDSKHIAFTDKTGAIYIHTIDGETKKVAVDPYANQPDVRWSSDSAWLTYSLASDDRAATSIVYVYNVEEGTQHQVTSGFFNDTHPVFGRQGKFLYFTSNRSFNRPKYEDVGTTFIYSGTEVIVAVPLQSDVKYPLLPESDEETWDQDKKGNEKEGDDENGEDEDGDGDEEDDDDAKSKGGDPITGSWSVEVTVATDRGTTSSSATLSLELKEDGSVTGSVDTPDGTHPIIKGEFDAGSNSLTLTIQGEGNEIQVTAKLEGNQMQGVVKLPQGEHQFKATRNQPEQEEPEGDDEVDDDDEDEEDEKSDEEKEAEPIEIEFDNIARRAFQLPVSQGNFGDLGVNDKNQLIYARTASRGESNGSAIHLFDLNADEPEEKTVVSGTSQFVLTTDGKKVLVFRGDEAFIVDAAAAQKLEEAVPTSGMTVKIDRRKEWKQVFTDAWRIERDFFYDPNMHGVDWQGIYDHYVKMLDDCTSRSDVSFVIREMISELNVGHAYYRSGPDPDSAEPPDSDVGLLGCTFEPADGRYRIGTLFQGAPWDTDARNPLRQADVEAGSFVLAINGRELTADENPYAAFEGMAGRETILTISDDAELSEDDRQVVVEPLGSDNNLRFRHWIENNRTKVAEATEGRVGYIYVINTSIPGQNDLVRQFFGQLGKEALIIDERWNGGGQIPTRFIELLNRPVTNYWAKRDGRDWTWPPDSHQGPKCMLINGMAGSGGDMFPALFRQAGLGKLIGMRTWGGLVGISGNPSMIDGSGVTAPTFAYYEKDGTWGIEGHGVDPDIRVVDDPSKMVDGGDPQLEAAIDHILSELESNPYVKPDRPEYPDRSGFGLEEEDK